MEFIYTSPQTELEASFGSFFCINAFGKIKTGDADRFRQFLEVSEVPPRTNIYIDSAGGHVEEAMQIGRIIRSGWFGTHVGRYTLDVDPSFPHIVPRKFVSGQCLSAATLVYLGGRLRHLSADAKFGVHQFAFQNPSPDDISKSQKLSAKIAKYVVEMGVNSEFLEISASAESRIIKLITKADLERLGVTTGGMKKPDWTIQALGGGLYVRGERDGSFGHQKVILAFDPNSGFGFLAVIEAMGREKELLNFGLVEIVVNGEDVRIDISDRCERNIDGIYVSISASLSTDEVEILVNADSFGIQVRFCSDAEVFLGISAMETGDGKEALHSLFAVGFKR